MISEETQLKLQAWLDGELTPAEAAAIESLVSGDAGARALVEELRHTAAALSGHEAGITLPESRDFYWSKIKREIGRQEAAIPAPRPSVTWFAWLQRHVMSVSATALLACLIGIFAFSPHETGGLAGEVELASDKVGSYTYRDQDEQLTMVWLYDKNGEDAQPSKAGTADDPDVQ